jgi:hypothetical protein
MQNIVGWNNPEVGAIFEVLLLIEGVIPILIIKIKLN